MGNLLALLIGLSISAILAGEAIPSYLHRNQQMMLQAEVYNLKAGLGYSGVQPAATLDPSWRVPATATYVKSFPAPAGTLVSRGCGAIGSYDAGATLPPPVSSLFPVAVLPSSILLACSKVYCPCGSFEKSGTCTPSLARVSGDFDHLFTPPVTSSIWT